MNTLITVLAIAAGLAMLQVKPTNQAVWIVWLGLAFLIFAIGYCARGLVETAERHGRRILHDQDEHRDNSIG